MARLRFGIYVCMYITVVNAYPLLEATLKCQNKCGCKKKKKKSVPFFFFFFFPAYRMSRVYLKIFLLQKLR